MMDTIKNTFLEDKLPKNNENNENSISLIENKPPKPLKLTTEILIEEFNSEQLSIPEIARKYNVKEAEVRKEITILQKQKILGYKNRLGKIVAKAGEPSPFKREKQKKEVKPQVESGLADLLQDVTNVEVVQNQISTYHKELLVEVLHKLIC